MRRSKKSYKKIAPKLGFKTNKKDDEKVSCYYDKNKKTAEKYIRKSKRMRQ